MQCFNLAPRMLCNIVKLYIIVHAKIGNLLKFTIENDCVYVSGFVRRFTHADPLLSCQLLHAALSVINTLVRLLGRGETVPVRIALSDWLNRWLTRLVRDRISVGLCMWPKG